MKSRTVWIVGISALVILTIVLVSIVSGNNTEVGVTLDNERTLRFSSRPPEDPSRRLETKEKEPGIVYYPLTLDVPANVEPDRRGFWVRVRHDVEGQEDFRFVEDDRTRSYMTRGPNELNFPNAGDSRPILPPGRQTFFFQGKRKLPVVKFLCHVSSKSPLKLGSDKDTNFETEGKPDKEFELSYR